MTCCCLGMQGISQRLWLFAMQCTLLRDRWKGLLHTACSHQYSIQRLFPKTKCKLRIPPFYKIRSLSRHDCTDAFCSDIFHTCLHRFVYQIWMQTSGGKCQCTHYKVFPMHVIYDLQLILSTVVLCMKISKSWPLSYFLITAGRRQPRLSTRIWKTM